MRLVGDPARPPLMCTLRPGAGAPLFLVPSVGTTPLSLVRLARAIVPPCAVHAFAYPGDDGERPPHVTLEALAAECVDEMLALGARGPWRLAGHCLGGAVVIAMAHELEARGEQVAAIVAIDAIAPIPASDGKRVRVISTADPATLEPVVRATLASLAGRSAATAETLGPELQQALRRSIDTYLDAAAAYRPQPCTVPIHLLETETDELSRVRWPRIAAGGLTRHALPGDTFSILRPPHVEAVGRILGGVLGGEA